MFSTGNTNYLCDDGTYAASEWTAGKAPPSLYTNNVVQTETTVRRIPINTWLLDTAQDPEYTPACGTLNFGRAVFVAPGCCDTLDPLPNTFPGSPVDSR